MLEYKLTLQAGTLRITKLKDTMTTKTKTLHPYHTVLKWVADGEEIQGLCVNNTWSDITSFEALGHVDGLNDNFYFQPNEFRIKPKPHIHQELMDARKAGAAIQFKQGAHWFDPVGGSPCWDSQTEYRIKPQPKPDIIGYCNVTNSSILKGSIYFGQCSDELIPTDNVKVTFCGETLKLKAIEMLRGTDNDTI